MRAAMRPVDGEFKHSPEERAAACAKYGHAKIYINLSVSSKVGKEIRMCHCGQENDAPTALKEFDRAKRVARKAAKGGAA